MQHSDVQKAHLALQRAFERLMQRMEGANASERKQLLVEADLLTDELVRLIACRSLLGRWPS